jgi:hypothetical protein
VRNLFAVLSLWLIASAAGAVILWSIAAHGGQAAWMLGTETSVEQHPVEPELSSQGSDLNIEMTTLPSNIDPYAGSITALPLR